MKVDFFKKQRKNLKSLLKTFRRRLKYSPPVEQLLQLVFPRRCPVCDEIVRPYGRKICSGCRRKLRLLTPPWCLCCGKKLYDEEELCSDCKRKKHAFVRARALYEYSGVVSSIYRLKYGKRQEYAEFFGEEIAYFLGDFIRKINPDGFVPIPLHRKRQRKRGYNQAALLAEAVGSVMGIPVYDDLVLRVKNTVPLKKQNPQERQNNLKKAFIIRQNDVKLDTIILIDDIYTTGSTVDEVATVFRKHGVRNVYVITLSCGTGV